MTADTRTFRVTTTCDQLIAAAYTSTNPLKELLEPAVSLARGNGQLASARLKELHAMIRVPVVAALAQRILDGEISEDFLRHLLLTKRIETLQQEELPSVYNIRTGIEPLCRRAVE